VSGDQHVTFDRPSVLFVCVRNAGKSQMAAALMRQLVGASWDVYSAGTQPSGEINELSLQVVDELGANMDGEYPKPIDASLVTTVDHVILLGFEVTLDPAWQSRAERWEIDEPSNRGIGGLERMRLVGDDIRARTADLAARHS
jgi:arsenate-mycothiol transferase